MTLSCTTDSGYLNVIHTCKACFPPSSPKRCNLTSRAVISNPEQSHDLSRLTPISSTRSTTTFKDRQVRIYIYMTHHFTIPHKKRDIYPNHRMHSHLKTRNLSTSATIPQIIQAMYSVSCKNQRHPSPILQNPPHKLPPTHQNPSISLSTSNSSPSSTLKPPS